MEMKKLIRGKLVESMDPTSRMSIATGILNTAAKHIYQAYRELDNAYQYIEDQELRKEIEDIKRILGNDLENIHFVKTKEPTVISRLVDIIDDRKPDNGVDMYIE